MFENTNIKIYFESEPPQQYDYVEGLWVEYTREQATVVQMRVEQLAIRAKVLGGNDERNVLRFESWHPALEGSLNFRIDLSPFGTAKDPIHNMSEAVTIVLHEIDAAITKRALHELFEAKQNAKPENVVRNELRRLVNEYGIETFTMALKTLEKERL